MAIGAQPVERLRDYLRQLSPEARALLIAELERAALRGDEIPGGDFVLHEVRQAVRDSREQAPRIGNPARLFFQPIEPFLVDERPGDKQRGRIARDSLEPIWTWICRDLAPDAAKTYSDEVSAALLRDQSAVREHLVRTFQDQIAARIQHALAEVASDDKARRRLAGQIGTPRAIEDARDVVRILMARDTLAAIASRLPDHVRNLADAALDGVKATLDGALVWQSAALQYVLVLVMSRLAVPWQLLRLAVRVAETDDAERIAANPCGIAVEIVLGDAERMAAALKSELRRGNGAPIPLLKSIHDIARGLRTELDLAVDSAWGRRLAAIRADVAAALRDELEKVPGRVRRLLRPRPVNEIAPHSVLDAEDVREAEALVELEATCCNYAGELAITEIATRVHHELEQFLDTGTQLLLDGLRQSGPSERPFRQSQVDAAVRFCAPVFGQEYASLLTKAAEVAANADRKTATAKA